MGMRLERERIGERDPLAFVDRPGSSVATDTNKTKEAVQQAVPSDMLGGMVGMGGDTTSY